MIGGFSVVAAALNDKLAWPDGRYVSRQQIEAWTRRGTLNKARQLPPSPVQVNARALRTTPTRVYDTGAWVAWVQPGVPGPRRKGWVFPVPRVAEHTVHPGRVQAMANAADFGVA